MNFRLNIANFQIKNMAGLDLIAHRKSSLLDFKLGQSNLKWNEWSKAKFLNQLLAFDLSLILLYPKNTFFFITKSAGN